MRSLKSRLGLVLGLALALSACSPTDRNGAPSAGPSPTAASPSPTPPPEPELSDAPVAGRYKVNYRLVSSSIEGSEKLEKRIWEFDPFCAEGPCDARLRSYVVTKQKVASKVGWKTRALYADGRYRWLREIKEAYACGDVPLAANYEYVIKPSDLRLVDNRWVVSRFEGTFRARGTESGGCLGSAAERYLVRGRLLAT